MEQKEELRTAPYDIPLKNKDGQIIGHATFEIDEEELLQNFLADGMSEEEAKKRVEIFFNI